MTDQVLEILTDLRSRMTAEMAALRADMTGVKADMSTLKTDVSTLKTDVTGLRTDLTTLAADVAPMRAQLDGLPLINHAVTVIQRDVRSMRDDMTVLTAIFGRRPAPEFDAWLDRQGLTDAGGRIRPRTVPQPFRALLSWRRLVLFSADLNHAGLSSPGIARGKTRVNALMSRRL
jgi:hypothetical protein